MDVPEAFPDDLLAILAVPDRSLADTGTRFEAARQRLNSQLHPERTGLEMVFVDSLRLKGRVDELEARSHDGSALPTWADLATVLNCEYQLYSLNSATPIRYQPFLSHWVEAIQRWDKEPWLQPPSTSKRTPTAAPEDLTWWDIQETRLALVKQILAERDGIGQLAPRQLAHDFRSRGKQGFELAPFINILEEEGIYERSQPPPGSDATLLHGAPADRGNRASDASPAAPSRSVQSPADFKASILSRIQADPDSAHHTLMHLPLDLPSLDLINTMLQDGTYGPLALDPVLLVRDYIQHGLRTIERMGQTPAVPGQGGASSLLFDDDSANPGGKEEQIRAVKLLVLFMKNLVRKALVPPEELYFEIQEVCVRYIWIKEVREFKSFVEGVS